MYFRRLPRFGRIALLAFLAGLVESVLADDWPQWLGPQRDGVWRETGIVEKFPAGGPARIWRTEIASGYSGPAVAGGKVFVMDRQIPTDAPKPKSVFEPSKIPGNERVLCVDEKDGRLLWKHEYDCPYDVSYAAGPRTTPLVAGTRVYALGTMGNLTCLEVGTGKVTWERDFKKDYGLKIPTWGVSATPLLDGQKLICVVGGEGSVAVAFDKDSGRELWRSLSAREPGYCPPMIYELGGRRHLIVWHAEAVNGLDPETGKVLWSEPWLLNYGMAIPTPRKLGDRLFLTCFYNGSLMLRFEPGKAEPTEDWRSPKMSERDTTYLHSTMSTPWLEDGHIYGVCSYGQFRCLTADKGTRLWETFAPTSAKSERWGNAFIVKHDTRLFLFSEKGDLIIARVSPGGYEEIDRAHVIEPTNKDPGRPVVWSHPAFANRRVYVRNDGELVCVNLAAEKN